MAEKKKKFFLEYARFKIMRTTDRDTIILALVNAGYCVRIEEEKIGLVIRFWIVVYIDSELREQDK